VVLAVTPSVVLVLVFGAHGKLACFAQLRELRVHARRDLRYVRDEIGTKPHGIGRTSLALLRRAFIGGCAWTGQHESDGQCQQDQPRGPQHALFPFSYTLVPPTRRTLEHELERGNLLLQKIVWRRKNTARTDWLFKSHR
jgi:hypothetical protein